MKKKILSVILSGILSASLLVGCGEESSSTASSEAASDTTSDAETDSAETTDDQPYIIMINPCISLAVFNNSNEGFQAAAEELGFKGELLSCTELTDTAAYEMFQQAITKKPDAIIVCPWNYSAIASLYEEAQNQGIAVIDYSSDSGVDSGRISFVGTDNTTYGQLAADYLNEKTGGNANVLTMMANLDTSNQLEQRTAFEEKCASDYPGIKTVLVDEDNGDSVTALQKFEDDLKANPEIDTIFCLESIGGVAAANAIEELGLEGITILAIDDNDDTVQYVKDGDIWATMAQNFYKMGTQSAQAAYDYIQGKDVESTYDSGTVLITQENASTYSFD